MGSDLPYRITRVWVGSAEQLHPPGVCGASDPFTTQIQGHAWAVLGREQSSLLRTFWSNRFDPKSCSVRGKPESQWQEGLWCSAWALHILGVGGEPQSWRVLQGPLGDAGSVLGVLHPQSILWEGESLCF